MPGKSVQPISSTMCHSYRQFVFSLKPQTVGEDDDAVGIRMSAPRSVSDLQHKNTATFTAFLKHGDPRLSGRGWSTCKDWDKTSSSSQSMN